MCCIYLQQHGEYMTQEQKDYINSWYPHFGGSKISVELGIPKNNITSYANRVGLKLLPQTERICYYCKKNKCQKRRGNRCNECMRPKWNEYTKRYVNNNPLEQRFKNCLCAAKKRAKQKNKEFDIDLDFLRFLWKKQDGLCYYSGLPMVAYNYGEGYRNINAMSIDRIDCKIGYIKTNVVLCSYYANVAKSELSIEEWLKLCQTILDHMGKANG
jgi:hypothetical protein